MLVTNARHNLSGCFAVYISGGLDVHSTLEYVQRL